mmetsp:Transcript_42719/g.83763  ORF Transcript_42719/g.83763 Transcript_42719/m.83763 type:complete len:298 (+) Transcript_42719:3-896(+)
MLEGFHVVVDCTGNYGNANWVGKGGIPAVNERAAEARIYRTLVDFSAFPRPSSSEPNPFCGLGSGEVRHTVVVGSGASAITALKGLQDLARTCPGHVAVSWVTRHGHAPYHVQDNDPLPQRRQLYSLGNLLASAQGAEYSEATKHFASFRYFGNRNVVEFHSQPNEKVDLSLETIASPSASDEKMGGQEETTVLKDVDNILALVGFKPDLCMTSELQVHYCYATEGPMKLAAAMMSAGGGGGDCLAQVAPGAQTLKSPEPGLFILGMKSYGRNSGFLLRLGHEQVEQVVELLEKGDL